MIEHDCQGSQLNRRLLQHQNPHKWRFCRRNGRQVQNGKSTTLQILKIFCDTVCEVFASSLRPPNATDINQLLDEKNAEGWPGCLGSIDCMHWQWKNCPSAWSGQFKGKEGAPKIVLEAKADSSCRFWHFFFRVPGSPQRHQCPETVYDMKLHVWRLILHGIRSNLFQRAISG